MGKKRKMPFGYTMENGEIVVHTVENTWVRFVFKQYSEGASVREIMTHMKNSGVCYDTDKSWNINMVARILADGRYCGEKGYPAIIDQSVFHAALEKRERNAPSTQMTEAYKILRQKCNRKVTAQIENEVLYLLNTLAGHPERIETPAEPITSDQRLILLESELEEIMIQLPVDEEQAKKKLMEIAVVMYENIDPREYETQRMRKVFSKEKPRNAMDANLISANISDILVDGNGKVRLRLKNDQIIERGE